MVLFATLNFAVTASVAISNRRKAAGDELRAVQITLQKEIRELEEKAWNRLGQHSERLSKMETEIRNQITDDDISAVHRRVDETKNELSAVAAIVARIDGRIEEMSETLKEVRRATMRHREDFGHAR